MWNQRRRTPGAGGGEGGGGEGGGAEGGGGTGGGEGGGGEGGVAGDLVCVLRLLHVDRLHRDELQQHIDDVDGVCAPHAYAWHAMPSEGRA